jgi:L-malate glycosyltransferase
MRILYVSDGYTTHDHRFLTLLSGRHRVMFLQLFDGPGRCERRPLPDGVERVEWRGFPGKAPEPGHALEPGQIRSRQRDFERALRGCRPDLVHAGPVPTGGYLAALAEFHPVVAVSWGSDILVDAVSSEAARQRTRLALERADGFVCDCRAVLRQAREFAPLPDGRVALLPWGVESRFLGMEPDGGRLKRELALEGRFLVLATRSWEPVYGVDIAVEAFGKALAREPRLRLALLGDGSQAGVVAGLVARLGLAGSVLLPGRMSQEELPRWYQGCDCYLSCSFSDGSSVSLLEAMACGLPVVASDIAGNREWVRPGENGWLFAPGNSDAAAAALLCASGLDAPSRAAMGAANQGRTRERADWDENSKRLLGLYERIAAQGQAGQGREVHGP